MKPASKYFGFCSLGFVLFLLISGGSVATAQEDGYLKYIQEAPEFKRVNQSADFLTRRWNDWVFMPWRYRWTIGTNDAGGQFCKDHYINGGFTDWGNTKVVPWLEKWNLQFYADHTAGKGILHLYGANRKSNFKSLQKNGRALRKGRDGLELLDEKTFRKASRYMEENIGALKKSPMRLAYALDDEISWGAFRVPIPWRVHDDDAAYQKWLDFYYGGKGPKAQFVTPDSTRRQLGGKLQDIDLSPLLDRLTYNDSVWANFLGRLVEKANQLDPEIPTGFVGGQPVAAWGGFDYTKLMKKIQYLQIGPEEVARSFNPNNAIPFVVTHSHKGGATTGGDRHRLWVALAAGNRGVIGWVDGWFDGAKPKPWLADFKPLLKEMSEVQGKKLVGAQWIHDGVGLYYSHPSVQVTWCLDAEAHGSSWPNRGRDDELGQWHCGRNAWQLLLEDAGIQYNWLAYDEVIRDGVPQDYKVVILPGCVALSDIEAQRLREFAERGGTVIADYAAGIFDQHGKGRQRGALDDLFGVDHPGTLTAKDFFAERLWTEANQDSGFGYRKFRDLFDTHKCKMHQGYAICEPRLKVAVQQKVGSGKAIYLNVSPARYLQYRQEDSADAARRALFIDPLLAAGVKPWVQVTHNGKPLEKVEASYWKKDGRTMVFLTMNTPVSGNATGKDGYVENPLPLKITLAGDVKDVVDERTGKKLKGGNTFDLDFVKCEAVFFSFAGEPPRK